MASRRTLAWCGALRDGPSASSVPPQDKRNWCSRRNRLILRNLSAAASALAPAACDVGPDYKAPHSADAPAATGPFDSETRPEVALDPVRSGDGSDADRERGGQ